MFKRPEQGQVGWLSHMDRGGSALQVPSRDLLTKNLGEVEIL